MGNDPTLKFKEITSLIYVYKDNYKMDPLRNQFFWA